MSRVVAPWLLIEALLKKLKRQIIHSIEPPDSHFLSAAVGWVELGDATEAEAELNRISAVNQCHPDVLEIRWIVVARKERWNAALGIAQALLKLAPNRSSGWLHQAYSLRRAEKEGLQRAWEALLPAYSRFPRDPTIPYNLSCYACQMKRMDEARVWFRRAIKLGDKSAIKEMALADADLQPLWEEIRTL